MKQLKKENKVRYFLKADKTAKSLAVLVAMSLLLTVVPGLLAAPQLTKENNENTETIEFEFEFSTPEIIPLENGLVEIKVGDLKTMLRPGLPQLPHMNVVEKLPYNARNIEITYDLSPVQTMEIEGTVVPGPIPQLLVDRNSRPLLSALAKIVSKIRPNKFIKQGIATHELDEFNEIYFDHDGYGEFIKEKKTLVGIDPAGGGKLVKYAGFTIMPAILYDVTEDELKYIESANVEITYTLQQEEPLRLVDEYDLLIITADSYESDLDDLVTHKEDMGLTTKLVTISEITDEDHFDLPDDLRDLQEQIKYFIYKAKLEWSTPETPLYVMAVGGWRNIWGFNKPELQFPMRYSHNVDGEPGYSVEQYYSCILKNDESFDSWDSNENDRFAEWDIYGYDTYDAAPDVYFGRLACRSNKEVKTVVDKIITYETDTFGEEWFNKILSVTGDGFQDIGYPNSDNYVAWDISALDDGSYTIYAQSELMSDSSAKGRIDVINITIDRTTESVVTFGEDDHLEGKILPLDEEQETVYPGKPIAEIVIPQEDDILGNTDVGPYVPSSAYIGEYWAIVEYNATNGILNIRVKSYDPAPHNLSTGSWQGGSITKFNVWVNDSGGNTVFDPSKKSQAAYWEGEIEGEQALVFANGGTASGPQIDDGPFNITRIWTSNGGFYSMWDVLNAFSEGYGLAYVNGHSSCMVYGDHYPGIPGGRRNGQVNGWATINLQAGLQRYQASEGDPLFPLSKLTNEEKLPVVLYSGCHSGQFDTSLVSILYDPYDVLLGDRYATWTPEAVAWRLISRPGGGSIATIGNCGLGSGYIGSNILQGLTGWIFPRFFYNYNGEVGPHLDILGEVHTQTLIDYVVTVQPDGDILMSQNARKHFEQWNLLGDPTLKIGGYDLSAIGERTSSDDGESQLEVDEYEKSENPPLIHLGDVTQLLRNGDYLVTDNPGLDYSPEGMVSDGNGSMIVGFTYETENGDVHPGFAYSSGGAVWEGVIWATPIDCGKPDLYSWEDSNGNNRFIGSCYNGPYWGYINMPDITNPSTWGFDAHWGWLPDTYPGKNGCAVTAYEGTIGGVWTNDNQGVSAFWIGAMSPTWSAGGSASQYANFNGDCDQSTSYHFWVFERTASNQVYIVRAESAGSFTHETVTGLNPDVAADDGWTYVVYDNSGTVSCRSTSDNGGSWDTYTVTTDGSHPQVVITEDGDVECYFVRNTNVFKTLSTDNGENWDSPSQVGTSEVDDTASSPFQAVHEGMVYDGGDGDLYANIFIDTTGAMIGAIELDDPEDGRKINTTIINSGTTELDLDWEISIVGDSPLGDFLAGGLGSPILGSLIRAALKGRILLGRKTSDSKTLSSAEALNIESKGVLGIGHVLVTVTASSGDDVLAQKTEDGFLVGRQILLRYPEE